QISCRDIRDRINQIEQREIDWPAKIIDRGELAAPMAFLRRPFSLAGRRDRDGEVELDIIHRVIGVGTDWLARRAVGDLVDILGPLGNRFVLPTVDETAILIGGGVGIPPMLYLAEALARARRKSIAFCGAVTRDLLPLTLIGEAAAMGDPAVPATSVEEFARHGIASVISTDDGSVGFRGFVTQ